MTLAQDSTQHSPRIARIDTGVEKPDSAILLDSIASFVLFRVHQDVRVAYLDCHQIHLLEDNHPVKSPHLLEVAVVAVANLSSVGTVFGAVLGVLFHLIAQRQSVVAFLYPIALLWAIPPMPHLFEETVVTVINPIALR